MVLISVNDLFMFSGVTAAGQGVKVLSSVVPETSTTDVAEVTAITLLLWTNLIISFAHVCQLLNWFMWLVVIGRLCGLNLPVSQV